MPRLIPPLSAAERTGLITAARTYLTSGLDGGPAAFGHRRRFAWKVDCLGLVVGSFARIGYEMQDRDRYGRDPTGDKGAMEAAARAHFGPPVTDLQPGDVVLMEWHQEPNHVGLVTDHPDGLALIHSLHSAGCVVEHRLAGPWPRRVRKAFRP